jgi:dTDP-4-amino-4,6-dideoxygalactose transaminase
MAGMKSRLDPIQAAVLSVKLAHLDGWNARRSMIAARYRDGLADSGLALPQVPPWAEPVWHLFVARHPERDALRERLADAGISTLIHYPTPPHRQGAFASMASLSLPISEQLHREVFSLPIGPHLKPDEADRVIEAIGLLLTR